MLVKKKAVQLKKKDVTPRSEERQSSSLTAEHRPDRRGPNDGERSPLRGMFDAQLLSTAMDERAGADSRQLAVDELEQRWGWQDAARRLLEAGPSGIALALERWGQWLVGLNPGGIDRMMPALAGASAGSAPNPGFRPPLPGAFEATPFPPPARPTGAAFSPVQLKGRSAGQLPALSPEEIKRRLGSGRPLEATLRRRMERVLGADLSEVRVHTGSEADAVAEALEARAFAVGTDVGFAEGELQPGSPQGEELLAHELAHVVQQAEGRADLGGDEAGAAHRATLEQEADTLESRVRNTPDERLEPSETEDSEGRETGRSVHAAATSQALEDGEHATGLEPAAPSEALEPAALKPLSASPVAVQLKPGPPSQGPDGEDDDGDAFPEVDVKGKIADAVEPAKEGPPEAADEPAAPKVPKPPPTQEKPGQQQDNGDAEELKLTPPPGAKKKEGGMIDAVLEGLGIKSGGEITVPKVAAEYARFTKVVEDTRGQIEKSSSSAKSAVTMATEGAIADTKKAGVALRKQVGIALKAARMAVKEDANAARTRLEDILKTRKGELAKANQTELARVLKVAADDKKTVEGLYADLARDARKLGTDKSAALNNHARIQSELAMGAAAAIAAQYKDHQHARDIRLTVEKMGQEAGKQMTAAAAETAAALKKDGDALAQKLEKDGRKYVKNIVDGQEDAQDYFKDLLEDGYDSLEDAHKEALKKVDKGERDALKGLDKFEEGFDDALEKEIDDKIDALEAARDNAIKELVGAHDRALKTLDEQAQLVDDWVHAAHPSQWPLVCKELQRATLELKTGSAKVLADLEKVKGSVVKQFQALGKEIASGITDSRKGFEGKIDKVVTDNHKKMTDLAKEYDKGQGDKVKSITGGWKKEADAKIKLIDDAKKEAETGLKKTYADGVQGINNKYDKAIKEIDGIIGKLRGDMRAKAQELANRSTFDWVVAAVKNFAMGFLDAVVGFLKAIAIAVLVILAVVLIVAVIILIVKGAAALAVAAAAVAAFLAAAAKILAIIGLILTILSVLFAVVGMIRSIMDPGMTFDEKWNAIGKGVGDIVMEFLPDFGMSALTRADDVSDVAKAVDNLSDAAKTAENLGDVSKTAQNVEKLAAQTDGLAPLADKAADLSKSVDDVQDLSKQADNAVKTAENLGDVSKNAGKDVAKGLDNADAGKDVAKGLDNADAGKDAAKVADEGGEVAAIKKAYDQAVAAGYKQSFENFQEIWRKGKRYNPETGGWYKPKVNVPEGAAADVAEAYKQAQAAGYKQSFDNFQEIWNKGKRYNPETGGWYTPKNAATATDAAKGADEVQDAAKGANDSSKTSPQAGDGVSPAPAPVPDAPGPGVVDQMKDGWNKYDPNTAPEWLKKYREAAELEAQQEKVGLPRLQATYDIVKGIVASLYQVGTGIMGEGNFLDNMGTIGGVIKQWLTGSAARANEIEKEKAAAGK